MATKDIMVKLQGQINQYHSNFNDAKLTFDVFMAYAPENDAGEKTGPALKLHGYPCGGLVSIVSLKNRVCGRSDAEIVLDGDSWDKLTSAEQDALLDHELEHVVVARDLEGAVIYDTHGRPKLKLKLHDREHGWFDAIAKRHGDASGEVQQARRIVAEAMDIYFQSEMTLGDSRKPKQKKLKAPKA